MKIRNVQSPIVNKQQNKNNKNVSFSGNLISKAKDTFTLVRQGTMNMDLFTLNAFVFLLGSRLITSRDNNERRETLTRDVPTIIIAVYSVPFIERFAAKILQKHTGFALGEKKGKHTINVANYDKLNDWYKYDNNLSSGAGFKGFAERLSDKGGNLKKIFSSLSDNIKSKLSTFKEDNQTLLDELKSPSSEENKKLMQNIEKSFGNPDNKAFKKVWGLKAVPKIAGFAVTLATIGIFIPKLNIFVTERINKNKKRNEDIKKA